jgi:hypothetical protein
MPRKRTPEEIEQKRLTLEERRLKLASDLLDDAEKLRLQLWQPATVHHWGSETTWHADTRSSVSVPVFREHEIEEPTFADKTKLLIAIGIAVDKCQLLSGEATSRSETMTPEEAKERIEAIYQRARLRVVDAPPAITAPREVINVER